MKQIVEIFLITILAELVAVLLLTFIGGIFSKKARWVLTGVFGRLLDIDVDIVFRSKKEAEEDISFELRRASFVFLLTGRGNELQREMFNDLIAGRDGLSRRVRILLPISDEKVEPDWTQQRENEIAIIDPAFGDGILRAQIETTVRFLKPYLDARTLELKRFNCPHLGRILLTDRVAYFTPYRSGEHGRNSHVIKYTRSGDMYEFFMRLFNQLWDN